MKRKRKKNKPTPRLLPSVVVDYWRHNGELPGLWDDMSHLARAKADGEIWWPDYCPIPIGAAYTVLHNRVGILTAGGLSAELTAAWAWDQERVVYRFDPTLARTLIAQAAAMDDTDTLPAELISRLPHKCFFCESSALEADGFFCWLEYDENQKEPELRMQELHVDGDKFATTTHILHLTGGTIKDCIDATTAEIEKRPLAKLIPAKAKALNITPILRMLQLVLYLLAVNNETRPATDGAILVGQVTGQSLRADPKAHIRRAHWHHYWVGSESRGDRHLELRWIPPVQVGGAVPAPKVINIKEAKVKNGS